MRLCDSPKEHFLTSGLLKTLGDPETRFKLHSGLLWYSPRMLLSIICEKWQCLGCTVAFLGFPASLPQWLTFRSNFTADGECLPRNSIQTAQWTSIIYSKDVAVDYLRKVAVFGPHHRLLGLPRQWDSGAKLWSEIYF